MGAQAEEVDLFIIGGGINGCGIARDAVGRGLTVALAEQGDLAPFQQGAYTGSRQDVVELAGKFHHLVSTSIW